MTDIHNSDEFDIKAVCDFRLLCRETLKATIPTKWLKEGKAVSVDQTAFPTFFKCRDFRKQADVEKEVERAIEETGMIPDDLQWGPDGKLIRCDDLDARAGHRSASAATGHKATGFLGYFATFAVLTRIASSEGDSEQDKAKDAAPAYIAGMSVDPASYHPGHAARKAVEDANSILPNLKEVLADRGISQCGEAFVRAMHELGLDVIRDLKSNEAQPKLITVGTGKHSQQLLTVDGMFFPMWLPKRFWQAPEGLTDDQLKEWYESRARFRWSRTQRFGNGDMQFRCPQCAGRLVTNLKTRRKRVRANKSAPFVKVTHSGDECCKGLVTIPVDKLDYWQPDAWGTKRWKKSYNRRLQVENVNSMVRRNRGLSPEMCRVRGIGPHTLAVLALAISHNLNLAKKDPDADNTDNGAGQSNSNGVDPGEHEDNPPEGDLHTGEPPSSTTGDDGDNPLRAPP